MAIYHLHAKPIQRSEGESAVAASAYRSASCIMDARTGITHDYTRKQDVLNSTILLPEGAPEAFRDRATLWNTVELGEKRKDAQPAREIHIALPRELNDAQNWQLALDYVQREFVDKGMIADVAFHRGHGGTEEEQPHMHIMLTMRDVTMEGFGQKVRAWNRTDLLREWRAHWGELCNQRLAELGFDMKIDHRTLEAQGINLEPTHYRSGKVDKRTKEKFVEYIDLAQRNGARLLNDPGIALKALTRQQSTFTHHDVARFVNRHTVDTEEFNAVYAKVMASKALVPLGKDQAGLMRYTSQELFDLEKNMLTITEEKAKNASHRVDARYVDKIIKKRTLTLEQQEALRHITEGADLASVVGFAGTGKSYMLGAARAVWEARGYTVQGMTLSGIAAESLEASSEIRCNTIANRLIVWQNGIETLSHQDVLVIDEAGMIGSRQMHGILEMAQKSGAKVVLVGDPEQLQAIDAGASFRAITERVGFAQMSDIQRQKEPWQKDASRHFGLKKTKEGLCAYVQHGYVYSYASKARAMSAMIEKWDEVRCLHPDETQIMLAYTRLEVKQLNEAARTIRHQRGELGEDSVFSTQNGSRTMAEGDKIYFLKNDKELRVRNGNLGTIIGIEKEEFRVQLNLAHGYSREVRFNLKEYPFIDYGYASTVYKAQAITVDRAQVLASRFYDSHATYVSMTRHRCDVTLYYSREEFQDFEHLARRLSRDKSKDVSLDYIEENQAEKKVETTKETLSRRMQEIMVKRDIERIVRNTGLDISQEYKEGILGIYRDAYAVAGRSYGLIETQKGEGKLIPAEHLESCEKEDLVFLAKITQQNGREEIRGVQAKRVLEKVQARQMSQDQDLGLGY